MSLSVVTTEKGRTLFLSLKVKVGGGGGGGGGGGVCVNMKVHERVSRQQSREKRAYKIGVCLCVSVPVRRSRVKKSAVCCCIKLYKEWYKVVKEVKKVKKEGKNVDYITS